MTTNSTWAALQNPAFGKLWIAAVISGACRGAPRPDKLRLTFYEYEMLWPSADHFNQAPAGGQA